MSIIKIKKIADKDFPIYWEGSGVFNLSKEYYLTDSGVLIDNSGNLIWNVELDHCFSKAVYIKNKKLIITDRIITLGMGGDFHLGIACLDMRTGNYRWKYFYDVYETRANLKNKEPDINMIRNIKSIDSVNGHIYADGFKIDLENGYYEYIGNMKIMKNKKQTPKLSNIVKPLKEKEGVKFKVNVINIDGKDISKEGYFFNKCDSYISSQEGFCFFGIPAKSNPQNAILFKYSTSQKKITEEIKLPFRNNIVAAYNFFDKGILLISAKEIWLLEGLLID